VTDHAEVGCGSWAAFKLAKRLLEFTGHAGFGDWVERVYYNRIGAALQVRSDGRTYYYADYRVSGAPKDSPTRRRGSAGRARTVQAVSDFHELVCFRDEADGLYVNLFAPAEVAQTLGGWEVTVLQETTFPASDTSTLTVRSASPATFMLAVRMPRWCLG
jgi:DUF1680 family protein